MAIKLVVPSLTLDVGEGGTYRWKDKKRFIDELINRGLKESQVDKVWRMYADRDFILRHGVKGELGMEYVIDQSHMAGMAHELGMHGIAKGKTGAWRLAQLVMRAGSFVTWIEDKDEVLQFASPMYVSSTFALSGRTPP